MSRILKKNPLPRFTHSWRPKYEKQRDFVNPSIIHFDMFDIEHRSYVSNNKQVGANVYEEFWSVVVI